MFTVVLPAVAMFFHGLVFVYESIDMFALDPLAPLLPRVVTDIGKNCYDYLRGGDETQIACRQSPRGILRKALARGVCAEAWPPTVRRRAKTTAAALSPARASPGASSSTFGSLQECLFLLRRTCAELGTHC